MSITSIPLRKLLQLMYAPPNLRVSKLREDIRNDINREHGEDGGGPDFFSPFWRSAKDHIFGVEDLHDAVARHIAGNVGRRNLYPQLRDGFLLWWNMRRRWTNEPFRPAESLKGTYSNQALGTTVKIGSILAVRDGQREDHFVYPYFSLQPVLPADGARLGLWVMCQAFPQVPQTELRLLDVIRGENYALERLPLLGDEQHIFEERYSALIDEWRCLREEYE